MLLLKHNSKGDAVVLLQELLQEAGYSIAVIGIMNSETVAAVKDFQLKNNLVADGIVFTKTWTRLLQTSPVSLEKIDQKFLSEAAINSLAENLGLEPAILKAVNKVESSGRGFLIDGRPKILFEGHIFWSQLKKKNIDPWQLIAGNENVLYPKWTKKYYKGGAAEYERLDQACKILNNSVCMEAAYSSASWGLFQIMGFHYAALGYSSVIDFVSEMKLNEDNHLKIFGKFLIVNKLTPYLQRKQWAEFARRYNGGGYKINKYDEKLAKAYADFSQG
ncbi:MAG TPA: N-acetylmuramidase family protein [Chitinophagales bacterium]|nr:N-acetylmuramidase family protein [Chitinophagales bacterium]